MRILPSRCTLIALSSVAYLIDRSTKVVTMEASRRWPYAAWFMAVLGLVAVFSSSEAYVFYAGGRDGWVVDPAESFNHWAERNRFQVNDTIGTCIISIIPSSMYNYVFFFLV